MTKLFFILNKNNLFFFKGVLIIVQKTFTFIYHNQKRIILQAFVHFYRSNNCR